jgi:hypothetical protein
MGEQQAWQLQRKHAEHWLCNNCFLALHVVGYPASSVQLACAHLWESDGLCLKTQYRLARRLEAGRPQGGLCCSAWCHAVLPASRVWHCLIMY